MPQSLTCLNYHIVFSTKNRIPQLASDWQPRLHEYLGGILRTHEGCLLSAGGMPDHIHLLASIDKQMSISEALRILKTNSSGWIHDCIPGQKDFVWQSGYAAFSVSHSNLESVRQYILNQAAHHQQGTFKEELIALLKKHDVEYDESYLWD